METNQRNGNLHIKLNGIFTPDSAAKLTVLMSNNYLGKGNIFIHTDQVSNVSPGSQCAFNELVDLTTLPGEKIYLMGEKGLAICHNSGKVLVRKGRKGHGSCGKCKNCNCKKKITP